MAQVGRGWSGATKLYILLHRKKGMRFGIPFLYLEVQISRTLEKAPLMLHQQTQESFLEAVRLSTL